MTQGELEELLRRYDQLVVDCATGQISFGKFLNRYGCFYLEYALDGHESDAAEQRLLQLYRDRLELHREIVESVIYRLTSEELLAHPEASNEGFIVSRDGLDQVKALAQKYLNIPPAG